MKIIKLNENKTLNEYKDSNNYLGTKTDVQFEILKTLKSFSSNFSVLFGGVGTFTIKYKLDQDLKIDNLYRITQMVKQIVQYFKEKNIIESNYQKMDIENSRFSIKLKMK